MKKDVVIKKANKPAKQTTLPISISELREQTLLAAGITVQELGETMRLALDTIKEALVCEKEQIVTHQGKITATHKQRDFNVALKAIATLTDTLGISASKNSLQPIIGTQVNVTVNCEWANQLRAGQEVTTLDTSFKDVT